ncbi:hypothetical protein ID858_15955 [Xenorhabdus sp. DI]|uniref:hypothetical protein n=1 Tax=Xenorhabdus doucetiae TaxID=351671 RepID=UPI0019B6F075|nr:MULTISPECIES: hypothetical protein [unclassified Xenorhabdus]MBD2783803.1 hypothetical protein [Xenorhabdus sp. 3]MBD2789990.1 hypothetical protein [Xenorhabdus sp. DI]
MNINYLQPDDLAALQRFQATTDDNEGYDIPTEQMHRLAEIGVIQYCGADVYTISWFGMYVLNQSDESLQPPFKTESDRDHG